MEEFLQLWQTCTNAVARYVHLRINDRQDAEDVLQEIMTAAYLRFDTLRDQNRFKPWVLGIARNKCADCLRRHYARPEVPLEDVQECAFIAPRFLMTTDSAVERTMELLSEHEQRILRLFYWQELPHAEIARRLEIPSGTVKSRLHTARQHFRAAYPQRHDLKGANTMKEMPMLMPNYTITPSEKPPFPVKWEELMGWFIVPKLGEKLSWAMYDFPERVRTEADDLEVIGRAVVHGIEGVEISVRTRAPMECNAVDDSGYVQRSFVAQLTDTHCRILSETHTQDGVRHMYTFLDGDAFLNNWGFGDDNCGNETDLRVKGDIVRDGTAITAKDKNFLLDVVGRYTVEINGKKYDTICVMDVETYMGGMATEQYIDQTGRTVLWRRFNSDVWKHARYGRLWSEMLPDNERITINGKTYVHWYDCITSHIL